MDLEGIRTLVAPGWVAAGFPYGLGVSLDWPEVRPIARFGGWTQGEGRPPGEMILTRVYSSSSPTRRRGHPPRRG